MEFVLYFVIFLFNFLIFFKTREIFVLTEHRGIGYFRRAFLFFGVGCLFYLLRLVLLLFEVDFFVEVLMDVFVFFALVTFSYFVLSLFYRRFDLEFLVFLVPLVLVLVGGILSVNFFYLTVFSIYFLVLGVSSVRRFVFYRKKGLVRTIYFFYVLFSGIWLVKFCQIYFF